MKKILNIWNIVLLAFLGAFATSCLNEPEIMPCYGVPSVEATSENIQETPQNETLELSK